LRRQFPPPRGCEPLADYGGSTDDKWEKGWLVRMQRTGTFAVWLSDGSLRSVDQRKAAAALATL
jgi:hypothetical protein